MEQLRFSSGRVALGEAWTLAEIRATVPALLAAFEDRLPADRGARVVIKPNLNNDLPALVGNSVDLRVLGALLEGLRERGYHQITVADGSNVGVERRGIDSFRRLRVDRLASRYGARVVDLNHDEGEPVPLHAGARPRVARTVLEAECLISVPKIKTHVEAGLSCALKNWVGICRGQEKRQMHYDLGRNILALGRRVRPHLVLVDGLVGMEGNGPGDGEPFRFGRLLASDDALLNDLVVARLVGLELERVPYLAHARADGLVSDALLAELAALPVLRRIQPAPPRSLLARAADDRRVFWLKRLARPLTDQPAIARAAYRLGVIQDVYGADDDGVSGLSRDADRCGPCRRCEDFCPTALPLEQIGAKPASDACINCLYCWWVCPTDALRLEGPLHHLEAQAARYRGAVRQL